MGRFVVTCVLILVACGREPPARTDTHAPVAPLTPAESVAVAERGGAIATAVAQGLAQQLQARLAEEGAAGAVDFCAVRALELTDSLVAPYPGVEVKRTSTRIRNPLNAPDDLERAMLAWYDSVHAADGVVPPERVQAAGAAEARIYRPLVVAPFCAACHGARDALDPAVVRILAERYPGDEAVGYAPGDLRGVIRVSVPRPGGGTD